MTSSATETAVVQFDDHVDICVGTAKRLGTDVREEIVSSTPSAVARYASGNNEISLKVKRNHEHWSSTLEASIRAEVGSHKAYNGSPVRLRVVYI